MTQTHQQTESERSGSLARARHEHDWHSQDYVGYWITKDRSREDKRRPLLQSMVDAAPFAKEAALRVLDVGGGYGVVSNHVLATFPHAEVTVQDFSQAMLGEAREHLAIYGERVRYAFADLRDRSWMEQFDQPFDLVVSAIAIHNLMDMPTMAACYGEIRKILKPGGYFLDCDHFDHVEDIEAHIKAFKKAGYAQVECLWYESPTGIIRARA